MDLWYWALFRERHLYRLSNHRWNSSIHRIMKRSCSTRWMSEVCIDSLVFLFVGEWDLFRYLWNLVHFEKWLSTCHWMLEKVSERIRFERLIGLVSVWLVKRKISNIRNRRHWTPIWLIHRSLLLTLKARPISIPCWSMHKRNSKNRSVHVCFSSDRIDFHLPYGTSRNVKTNRVRLICSRRCQQH